MEVTQIDDKPKIREIIGSIEQLPTPPFVFQQIAKILSNPYTSAFDIAAIISEDAAITAKVLKLTNSAYYGLAHKISNVKQAVVVIGLEALKSLVLSSSLIDAFGKGKQIDKNYTEAYWRHSLATAIMAKILARITHRTELAFQEEAFSAGILHDIGKLVIASYLPEKHIEKMRFLQEHSTNEHEAENIVFDCTHVEVGRYFAESWKLPRELADAVYFHHAPASVPGDGALPYLVHLANNLVHLSNENDVWGATRETSSFYLETWNRLGLNSDMQDKLIQELAREYVKSETFLHLDR